MSNYNKVILLGNLTRDPEVRYTDRGTTIAKIGLAVNRKWKGDNGESKEDVTFVDATAFGRTAEVVGQYYKKGRLILLDGRLRTESWDDKQTGQKRTKLSVAIESVQLLGNRDGGETVREPERPTAPPTAQPAGGAIPDDAAGDDVPF